jgi:uncharacterized protein (TIGR04255 family)
MYCEAIHSKGMNRMDKLPLKLKRDLITEAVFEIRFGSSYPSGAIFGIVYQIISKHYENIQNIPLPILQIPEAVRSADPNLKYQPHNKLQVDSCGFNVGSNVINFFVQKPYIGWSKWKPLIENIITELLNINLFKTVERTGLRYIDFIEKNLFSIANMSIEITGKKLTNEQTSFRTEFADDNYTKIVQMHNNVNVILENNQLVTGSLIDIDVVRNLNSEGIEIFSQKWRDILEESHQKSKSMFFNLLKKDFLNELEPVYE